MRTEYRDYVLAALRVGYCDCCAMSLWHQVCPVLCTVYCVSGIRSVVYSVGIRSIVYWVLGHWVLGPHALNATSKATALLCSTLPCFFLRVLYPDVLINGSTLLPWLLSG